MPFCPKCRCEYNVGVEQCVDCHIPLVLFRPNRRPMLDIDVEDLLVPAGALICLLGALVMLGLRSAATAGQVAEPLGSLVANQPGCLTVFYVIAATLSALVLLISLVRFVTGRR